VSGVATDTTFDVIVIGAGPAGEVVAARLAALGHAVAVIEDELVGGECSFYACMPSKALLRPAQALAEVRRVPGAAEAVTGGLDVAATLARRDEVIHHLDDAQAASWLVDRGITLIRGHGRLDGERRVRVGERVYEAREAVILAVGSAAAIPSIPGLREARPLTSRRATTMSEMPGSLIILGGGVVGVELAQAFCELGARVTVIEGADRLLAHEEPFASQQVGEALAACGVEVHVAVRATGVRRSAEGVVVELDDGASIVGEEILVAIGRRPLTDDLGVESVGLQPGEPVRVDDALRVSDRPWLYAIGDVNERSLVTHAGKYQAHIAAEVIDGGTARATSDARGLVPRVVFTEPQVAAVGLTLQAAEDQGVKARAYDVPSSATAGASFHGRNTPGTSRIVVDEDRRVTVGATFTGTDVAEWLHAATIAIVGEVPIERLWDAIPAFPTRSEVWLKLLQRREATLARA
jgi:pyruvate/2-oxoglutarate dehydrogenase complex dihydrolipoamide dehydrogenase (E3) component